MLGRQAGSVNCFSISASALPKAQNRAATGSILKEDEILCRSGYIIYLCIKFIYLYQRKDKRFVIVDWKWICILYISRVAWFFNPDLITGSLYCRSILHTADKK